MKVTCNQSKSAIQDSCKKWYSKSYDPQCTNMAHALCGGRVESLESWRKGEESRVQTTCVGDVRLGGSTVILKIELIKESKKRVVMTYDPTGDVINNLINYFKIGWIQVPLGVTFIQ